MEPWMFWLGVLAAVAVLLLGARLYDRRYRNTRGSGRQGDGPDEVLDQEIGRSSGHTRHG